MIVCALFPNRPEHTSHTTVEQVETQDLAQPDMWFCGSTAAVPLDTFNMTEVKYSAVITPLVSHLVFI